MISPREATLSLMGALRLARFDEKGALFFNTTLQGFWNSFWVAALIAPLYFLEFVLRWNLEDVSAPGLRYFSVEIIMYAMGWVAFPLAMVYVCRLMGWSERFLVIVYSLGLSWFVARHTLNITGLAASGVVALSVLINFMIRYWGAVLLI